MENSNTADSKILILYLVKNAPGVSYQMLMDKCMESLYTDFFMFSQCYNELIAGNLMDKIEKDTGTGEVLGTNETLHITPGGEVILEDMLGFVNKQVLGYIQKAASELKEKLEEQNSVTAFSEMMEDGRFMVKLSRMKNDRQFSCSFICSDKAEAEVVKKKWLSDSEEITCAFINNFSS